MRLHSTNMQRDVLVMNLEQQLVELVYNRCGRSIRECSYEELYYAVMELCKRLLSVTEHADGEKKVYYISAEFWIGRQLSKNLINMGIYERLRLFLERNGKDIHRVEEIEPEPLLGMGGMGRLAACYLDSIATLGFSGEGIGLNYHCGLFRQVLRDHEQFEEKGSWLREESWEKRTDTTFTVSFGERKVTSRMYDIDVVGYENGVLPLHLFDLESVDESLVRDGISFDKKDIEHNLTLFLYPNDSDEDGRLLRLYQEYFIVSNAAQWIDYELKEQMVDLYEMYNHAVIQINETHPGLIIPEMIRIMTHDKAIPIDDAIDIVTRTCAYTNHSLSATTLETWNIADLEKVVPQLVPIIRYLDQKVRERYDDPSLYIIDDNQIVHMAYLCLHYGFSVNGVAAIHTRILEEDQLPQFYRIYPQKFNNKTNGISFRRWLMCANHELTRYLSTIIGDGFKKDPDKLSKLLEFEHDERVLERLNDVKMDSKRRLVSYMRIHDHIEPYINGVFDMQIRYIHEHKRQQMNALYLIHKYLEIRRGHLPKRPVNAIFGALATPAYQMAKDIIHLLLVLEDLVNNDPAVSPYLRIIYVENYNVTYEEMLTPACDISEQISLASTESCGTAGMMTMLSGGVLLGVMDGANVEINTLVGEENCYIFGMHADEVIAHTEHGDYHPEEFYRTHPVVKEAVDFIVSEPMMKTGNPQQLQRLHDALITRDRYMAMLDLEDYIRVKEQMLDDFENRPAWENKMLVNIGRAGYFSSDRAVEQYNRDIWKLD